METMLNFDYRNAVFACRLPPSWWSQKVLPYTAYLRWTISPTLFLN